MKQFIASIALAAAVLASPAAARIAETQDPSPPESKPETALRAVVHGCLPAVLGMPNEHVGFHPASARLSEGVLGERTGTVMTDDGKEVFIVRFDDRPACRVVALSVSVAEVAMLTREIFGARGMPFRQTAYDIDDTGAFTARYVSGSGDDGLTIMVAAAYTMTGTSFATFTVSRRASAD